MWAGNTKNAPIDGVCFQHIHRGRDASLPSFCLSKRGSVRSVMRWCQLPRTLFFHQTTLLDLNVTSAGVMSFIPKSHSDETSGSWTAKELQLHTCLPAQYGQPEAGFLVRWAAYIWYRCSCPLGHLWQTQCTSFLLPRVMFWGWMLSLVLRS